MVQVGAAGYLSWLSVVGCRLSTKPRDRVVGPELYLTVNNTRNGVSYVMCYITNDNINRFVIPVENTL